MLHIITSNILPIRNIRSYTDNFVICHLFQKPSNIPYREIKYKYDFHIFHQDEMELETEEYMNSIDMEFHFIDKPDITQSLDQIIQTLQSLYEKYNCNNNLDETQQSEFDQEDFQVIIACDKNWNRQVFKYIQNKICDVGVDISIIDLYQYFNITNLDKLKSLIQSMLGTEFIYPEDPISFSYALYQTIQGI